ncbi:MAG TPA: hypothetical protein VNS55_03100 [Nocardioides sp.]|nr:hypothetical protein [Nocardioides sp.]
MPAPGNGPITSAQIRYGMRSGYNAWLDYDRVSDTGLVVVCRDEDGNTDDGCIGEDALVVGPHRHRTTLTCSDDRPPCALDRLNPRHGATLGPGPDEVTAVAGRGTVQVVGFDGRLRRTIDLTATGIDGEDGVRLDWSPDGRRLAVATTSSVGTVIWLVDDAGGEPEPAYTAKKGFTVWDGPWWSPDGQSVVVDIGRSVGPTAHIDLLVLHLAPDGEAGAAPRPRLFHFERHFDWPANGNLAWAPDGTRIAVRTRDHITEISAEDGSVIAQHPHVGWLIWAPRTQERP